MTEAPQAAAADYALGLANNSYQWYQGAAIRSRRFHRLSETVLLVVSAAIPASAAIAPGNSVIPAVLGSLVVVLAGLRAIFHWQDNYLRFSGAREAIEGERRLYITQAPPYDHPATRDQTLAAMVSKIERDEMAGWLKIAEERPKA